MHNNFRIALSLTLPLLTLTAGCGDDEPQTLTASAFRDQANQICTVGGEEIHQAFFSVVGTDAPTTDEMQVALDTVIALSHRQLDDIEELAEPSELSEDVNALVAQGHTDTDTAAAMGLEFFESDDDPWTQTNEMARALGLDVCAGE